MSNCWDNVIGIRGLCDASTPPISGLYINDLTGISLADLDSGVNEEDKTAYTLIQRKIDQAANMLKAESLAYLQSRWNYTTSSWTGDLGFYAESVLPLSASAVWRGIGMRYRQVDYIGVTISSVSLLLPVSGTIPVQVVDLRTGVTLDTFNVTAVANSVSRLVVTKTYQSNGQMLNLAVLYDATSVASFQTSLYPTYGCSSCGRSGGAYGWNDNMLERAIEISTAGQRIESNIAGGSFTGGLSVQYQVTCSFESLLCAHVTQLGYPLLYKTGMLLLKEMEFSKRLNGVIVFNRDMNQELSNYYQAQYDQYMQRYFEQANLPEGGCFACRQRVRQASRIP
jgi:hypothetical protein